MSNNDFDPASFGGGFGAGQSSARSDADHAASLARIRQRKASEALNDATNEIENRWIPYAVRLKGGLVARNVEREDLIAALKRLDPANAEQIAKDANQHRIDAFEAQKVPGNKEIVEINRLVREESEAGRRDR